MPATPTSCASLPTARSASRRELFVCGCERERGDEREVAGLHGSRIEPRWELYLDQE